MEIKSKFYTRTNDTGTHYARIIVPKALRAFVAKPAVWRSLSTKDASEAVISGIVVAVGTHMVFQELSDSFAESAAVLIDAEIGTTKIDIALEKGKVNKDELLNVTQSLKKSLGIKVDNGVDGKSGGGGNDGGSRTEGSVVVKKKSKTGTLGVEFSESQFEAGESLFVDQDEPEPPKDDEVENYLERRPHGVYRFRYWVPRPLQIAFGQREVRGTLKTTNRREAIEKARPLLVDTKRRMRQLSSCIR